MQLATWNVNSLKVRLEQLLDWIGAGAPEIICLQETKLDDPKFPADAVDQAGYHVVFAGQKTYNGVAIISRAPCIDVVRGIPGFADEQKRVIAATIGTMRIINAYVPNGQSVDSDKYRYKLDWLSAFTGWLAQQMTRHSEIAVLGDFNIAPDSRDVHDPKAWEGKVLFSEPERAAFKNLTGLGFVDSFRLFEQPDSSFTWWDYRLNAFKRGMGLRIDHILLSPALAQRCRSVSILKDMRALERPSDHAPVVADIAD
ncbi:MAG: exodeoxyribonuclease III [Betaproteobacteria bacterium]|nr:MAG: exodeoxyribonuclease III [Betaproteobacteria bacterium]